MGAGGEPHEILVSHLAGQTDLADLVELFVGDLPDRVAAMEPAFGAADRCALGVLAHQLKGAAGSYGFAPISAAAGELEEAARGGADAGRLRACIDALCDLCRRARARPT